MRTALFVPAHRSDFLAKAEAGESDAVILDLEDGVAGSSRTSARATAAAWLSDRNATSRPVAFARINAIDSGRLDDDLEAVTHEATKAILIPKVEGPEDVRTVCRSLSYLEGSRGLRHGHIGIWPLLESPNAILHAEEIFKASRRIAYAGGAAANGGDLARSLGFEATVEGVETLHVRSAVLLAARSAGVANPMTGMHTAIGDLEGLRSFALGSRRLGYEGMMIIHPSHAAVVNEVFSPSPTELADARQVIEALEAASDRGDGAVTVNGRMVDVAMIDGARRLIARHEHFSG